ncbi:MAG: AmmeMemoRadiSam system protein B [Phycisphaerae bacterium]|nr:AmmeMemoRadiSam system protein B [Phycisphaerae bacterium]
MALDPQHRPRLRPVEPFNLDGEDGLIALRDPSGISPVVLSISPAALQILACMDGEHTCEEISAAFHRALGQSLNQETLARMIQNLDEALLLESPRFDEHYDAALEAYRSRGTREMPHASQLGINDASGALFRDVLSTAPAADVAGTIQGIVAPHLDYPRGAPCYAAAYGALRDRNAPDRVVILGTNHFGRSTSVVATASAFSTPLGTTRVDGDFLNRLEARCGDLRRFELDHVREHSIELQVPWLQYLFGAENFTIVPLLCSDPCGPTGTAPRDGDGVDLAEFACALESLMAEDDRDTLVVAGADLSHIGESFGDQRRLGSAWLNEVRKTDEGTLTALQTGGPKAMVEALKLNDNATRVCSAGCIYALAAALPLAQCTVLGYHQAVDEATQTCVTCSAMVFTGERA